MNVGDLVEFWSTYENFMRDYRGRNPGLVIHVRNSASVDILWSNGDRTSEHGTYLRLINESR